MPENTALWLNAKRAPFAVGPAPYTAPRADEIVVRVRAVAVNPFDRAIRTIGGIITPWITYPFVVGSDAQADGQDADRLGRIDQCGQQCDPACGRRRL
jgi:NADPH:quinone reductase-like Zn-dependent oxidoreductase